MDIGRRPYQTSCVFLRDHQTVSTIRWVECKADAPALPYTSGIVSLDMEKNPWQLTGLGEVFGAPRTFTGQRAPDGFDGSHLCGDKIDFEEGGAYMPDIPPAPYDSQGFLACCMVPEPPPPAVPVTLSSNCFGSPSLVVGTLYEGNYFNGSGVPGWCWIINIPPGVTHRVEWSVEEGDPVVGQTLQLLDCNAAYYMFDMPGPGCYTLPAITVTNKYGLTFYRPSGNPAMPIKVLFKVSVGPCV